MASCTTAGAYKFASTKRCIREIFLSFTRNKNSRYLGYYQRKLSTPVFREREANYRKNVMKPLEDIPSLAERLKGGIEII